VEENADSLDEDNLTTPDDIVSACAALVTIDKESNVIQLIHFTTQEYLERLRCDWLSTAQLDIAATLLRVLSFRCFNSEPTPEIYMGRMIRGAFNEKKIRDHALLHYAATFWHHHASFVETELVDLMTAFLRHPNLILSANPTLSFSLRPSLVQLPAYMEELLGIACDVLVRFVEDDFGVA
jgi:hypothetical protein